MLASFAPHQPTQEKPRMETIIVYVDDADYAQQQLAPMVLGSSRTRWIVVGCAPRLTQRASKFLSHSARENWRQKWADRLFARIGPVLATRGDEVVAVLARGPLPELTQSLRAQHGPARLLDARRPKLGHELPLVTPEQPATDSQRWTVPGAVAGLGAVIVLAAE
jgi:hypothetical protein